MQPDSWEVGPHVNYIERLVDQSFREREDGSVVFFPWGMWGNGYLIESEDRYRRTREVCEESLSIMLAAVLGIGAGAFTVAMWLFEGQTVALAVGLAPMVIVTLLSNLYYASQIRPLLEGLEHTEESFDLRSRLWYPTAFPTLYSAQKWAGGATILSLIILVTLFEDADARVVGLSAGAIGVAVYVVRIQMQS